MTTKQSRISKEAAKGRQRPPSGVRPPLVLAVSVSREVLNYLRAMGGAHGSLSPEDMAAEILARHVERRVRQDVKKGEGIFPAPFDDEMVLRSGAESAVEPAPRTDNLSFQRIAARHHSSDNRLARLLASDADAES